MKKNEDYYVVIASIASIIILLVGTLVSAPYFIYQLLRWIVCGSSILNANKYSKSNQLFLMLFIGLAILFNPIAPIYMNRETWRVFDVIALLIFIGSLIKL